MLNKEDLLGVVLATKVVKLKTGSVMIKEFTTSAREEFELMAMKMSTGGAKNMKAKLIAISCINENGTRLFGDDEVGKISQMPSSITEVLFNAILEINGMATDSLEEAGKN